MSCLVSMLSLGRLGQCAAPNQPGDVVRIRQGDKEKYYLLASLTTVGALEVGVGETKEFQI